MSRKCSWASSLSRKLIATPLDINGRPMQHVRLSAADEPKSWLVIAPADARIHPKFAAVFLQHAQARPDVDIFYADEIEEARDRGKRRLLLKPAFNATLLMAYDYIGFPVFIRASTYKRLGGFREGMSTATVYDMLLRALKEGISIDRIPEVMVAYNGSRLRPTLEDRQRALKDWIGKEQFIITHGLTEDSLQLKRIFLDYPAVTIVVPTAQSLQLSTRDPSFGIPNILSLLDSVTKTDWPLERINVLIGDDVSDESIYAGKSWRFGLRRIVFEGGTKDFNYAAKMNQLWRLAETEFLVLMHDSVVIRDASWLRALMTFAMDDDVAVVGARLLYGDGRLQHAGIPGGLFHTCAHAWDGQEADAPTYQDWAMVHREWSMVTGAVFATRRSALESVAGFDERFALEYTDADLCLRLRLLGYKIVYTPFAELIHYRNTSEANASPNNGELALFRGRWRELLDNDPAFHEQFDRYNLNITPAHAQDAWYDAALCGNKRIVNLWSMIRTLLEASPVRLNR